MAERMGTVTVLLQTGVTYSFSARFMFELQNFSLVGGTALMIEQAVVDGLRTVGVVGGVRASFTAQGWGRETLLVDCMLTPGMDIQTGGIASVPVGWSGYVGAEPIIPEPSAPYSCVNAVLWGALNALYVRLRGGAGNVSTDWSTFGRPECAIQFSGYDPTFGSSHMVDDDTVLRGNTLPNTNFGANVLDQITFSGDAQVSTDANRNGTSAIGLPSLGGLPFPVTVVLIAGGVIVALVAIGYAARGVAQLAEET